MKLSGGIIGKAERLKGLSIEDQFYKRMGVLGKIWNIRSVRLGWLTPNNWREGEDEEKKRYILETDCYFKLSIPPKMITKTKFNKILKF